MTDERSGGAVAPLRWLAVAAAGTGLMILLQKRRSGPLDACTAARLELPA